MNMCSWVHLYETISGSFECVRLWNSQFEYNNQAWTVCNCAITIPSCAAACTCVKIYLALMNVHDCEYSNQAYTVCKCVCKQFLAPKWMCAFWLPHFIHKALITSPNSWLQVQTDSSRHICKVVERDGVEEAYSLFQDMLKISFWLNNVKHEEAY